MKNIDIRFNFCKHIMTSPSLALMKCSTMCLVLLALPYCFSTSHGPGRLEEQTSADSVQVQPRWNFRKTNWVFTTETERRMPRLPNPKADDADAIHPAYCNILIGAAKNIPRSFNKHYIESPDGTTAATTSSASTRRPPPTKDIDTTATTLLHNLDEVRGARWTEVVESVDFTYSIRKAWQTISKLIGRSTTHSRCSVTIMPLLRNF